MLHYIFVAINFYLEHYKSSKSRNERATHRSRQSEIYGKCTNLSLLWDEYFLQHDVKQNTIHVSCIFVLNCNQCILISSYLLYSICWNWIIVQYHAWASVCPEIGKSVERLLLCGEHVSTSFIIISIMIHYFTFVIGFIFHDILYTF